MPAREHEPVAVGPLRVGRAVAHDARVERGRRSGASAIGVPGWPELAFWTPSIASVRIVSMQSLSSAVDGVVVVMEPDVIRPTVFPMSNS